ncbi:MAG: cyclopropane-fatty-acyl-phospholipid synthase [Acidimicrobiales bacterium]
MDRPHRIEEYWVRFTKQLINEALPQNTQDPKTLLSFPGETQMHHSEDAATEFAHAIFGRDLPIRIRTIAGETIGSENAKATIVLRSDDALRHMVRAPGELGFARAYVSGALDIEGDIWSLVDLQTDLPHARLRTKEMLRFIRVVGVDPWRHRPDLPPEEIEDHSLVRRRHTRHRDAASIQHHYDVSNDFYRLILGPSWTYSCAVFENAADTLEQAQFNKYELIARKLDLSPGMRLLDVGCGWGGMVLHAARHHGVKAVGVTISVEQAEIAKQRVAAARLADRVTIRVQDYRDLPADRFDAISSIGMFEHVGAAQQREYFEILYTLLTDEGRLLNHQIGRTPRASSRPARRLERTHVHRRGFVHRYVFPDGELHEIGDLVGTIQRTGFEVRNVESLREHYALTLRHWVNNLDNNWDEAVDLVGEGRARVWKLYMAASSSLFASNNIQIHQVLAARTANGRSGFGFRPSWTGRLTSNDGWALATRQETPHQQGAHLTLDDPQTSDRA